jgi:hypothetical protein
VHNYAPVRNQLRNASKMASHPPSEIGAGDRT